MKLPINPVIKVGDLIFSGGIAPLDENGMIAGKFDAVIQTREIFRRIEQYLYKIGMTLDNLVFVTVYLSDIKLYDQMNSVYGLVITEPYPARKVVQTPLTLEGMVVEMTFIASMHKKEVIK